MWSHLVPQSKMDVIPILVVRLCVRIGVACSGLVCRSMVVAKVGRVLGILRMKTDGGPLCI